MPIVNSKGKEVASKNMGGTAKSQTSGSGQSAAMQRKMTVASALKKAGKSK
jgi:hypothetical protein